MEGRTLYSDIEISIDRLREEDNYELSSFSCGVDELDKFFHNEIMICSKYHYFSPYCAKNILNNEIVAIFTLANDVVILYNSDDKDEFIEQSSYKINDEYIPIFQQQTSFPAVNIGHLGVRKDIQSKGIGEQVLDFILNTFIAYDVSGCQFITVDSLNNPKTNKFYARNGFLFQTNMDMNNLTRRMYLPIELYRNNENEDE
jgi:GNAT superfamily N-acetyltransferase